MMENLFACLKQQCNQAEGVPAIAATLVKDRKHEIDWPYGWDDEDDEDEIPEEPNLPPAVWWKGKTP